MTAAEATTILRSLSDDPRFASGIASSRLLSEAKSPLHGLVVFTSQGPFVRPAIELADMAAAMAEDAQIWLHELATKDPVPGPLQSFSWHSLGLPLLLQQPLCMRASSALATTAEMMGKLHTSFLYGEDPWEAYGKGKRRWCLDGEWSGLSAGARTDEIAELFEESAALMEAYSVAGTRLLEVVFKPKMQ